MDIRDLTVDDLTSVVMQYVRDFEYDTADIDEGDITIHLDSGKCMFIHIGLENEEED